MGVPSVSFCGQDANDSRPAQTNKLAAARPLRLVAATSRPPRHWHANTAGVTQKQVELFCGELVAVARQALRLGGRRWTGPGKKRQVLPFVKSPKWAGWWLVACQARPRSTGLKEGGAPLLLFLLFLPAHTRSIPPHLSFPIIPPPSPILPTTESLFAVVAVSSSLPRLRLLRLYCVLCTLHPRCLRIGICRYCAAAFVAQLSARRLAAVSARRLRVFQFLNNHLLSSPNGAPGRARCRAPHAIAGRPPFTQRRGPQHQTAAKRHLIAVASNNPSIRRTPHTARPTTVQSSPPWLLRRCPLRLCACPHTASQTHTLCRACALARHTCLSPIARDGHSHGRCRCRCRAPGSPVARHRQPPGLCASHRQSAADLAHHENAPFFAQFSPTRSELPGGR